MTSIQEAIDVRVPVREAYDQWTQFEEFPRFMEGVVDVRQLDETHTRWVVEGAGERREFDAEITEQTPDQRIAWNSTDGPDHAGVVTFHRLSDGETRIMVQMDAEPDGLKEKVADMAGLTKRRVKGNLERFKDLIEARGTASGAWRGEVSQDPTR
jgi:uncharacterized membrane protein